jgi:hypothetical protein
MAFEEELPTLVAPLRIDVESADLRRRVSQRDDTGAICSGSEGTRDCRNVVPGRRTRPNLENCNVEVGAFDGEGDNRKVNAGSPLPGTVNA